jgi:SAM-dependent methyltransferase
MLSSEETALELEEDGITPVQLAAYAQPAYWDRRFAIEEKKDWLCSYADIHGLLERVLGGPQVARERRLLLVGSGNSPLPRGLAADGYKHVHATDISRVVIAACRAQQKLDGVSYGVEDMRRLSLEDESFDAYVDKAALDALLVGGDVWEAAEDAPRLMQEARSVMDEAYRVLATGGVYICITFSQPHFRKQYLQQGAWAGTEVCVRSPI